MAIRFRKQAIKFIEKADSITLKQIQDRLNQLSTAVEEQGIIPFTELDIKQMKGEWDGFYRLRIGKIRLIFTVNTAVGDVEVYAIGSRGDIYTK
jgi:mRNA interferase RelE/StbE